MHDTHNESSGKCPSWCVQCEYHDEDQTPIREHLGEIVPVTTTTTLQLSSIDDNPAWVDWTSDGDTVWRFPIAIALSLARVLIELVETAGNVLT